MVQLEDTKPEAHFVGRRYSHDISNVIESLNKALVEDRELLILQLLDALWHRVMDKRAFRLTTATKAISEGFTYTPFCASLVAESH